MPAVQTEASASAAYDPVADLYDRAFSDIRVRKAEVQWLDAHLRASKLVRPHLLDIGCGTGAVLRHLAPHLGAGVGADVSAEMLAHAQRRASDSSQLRFAQLTRPGLPFAENQFDVVLSFLSFRYMEWHRIFPEILRVLRPGGRFLMIDLVHSKARVSDAFGLLRSAVSHVRRDAVRPGFKEDLAALVRHPAWSAMLARHPMRPLADYKTFFAEMLPGARLETLHVLPGRRIVALDSGPLGR